MSSVDILGEIFKMIRDTPDLGIVGKALEKVNKECNIFRAVMSKFTSVTSYLS